MPRIQYIEKRFQTRSLQMIQATNRIVTEYAAEGYVLTVRQIYYQFVRRGWFPEDRRWVKEGAKWVRDPDGSRNAEPNYKWLAGILTDGRMAGMIDWEAIEDRTRNLHRLSTWETPQEMMQSAVDWYLVPKWDDQPRRVEVWIEKEALSGVFQRICDELEVPFFACRGYPSVSSLWEAAEKRFLHYEDEGQEVVVLHFGDHDPSGIDMTRNLEDQLFTFGSGVDIQRIALTMDQVEEWNPPPDPAKKTDARYRKYERKFGPLCWELDALEPAVLAGLVRDHVLALRDEDLWAPHVEEEEFNRSVLEAIRDDWDGVVEDYLGFEIPEEEE